MPLLQSLTPAVLVTVLLLQTRGRKAAMEDRHVLAALDPSQGVTQAQGPVGLQQQVSVGAVFDGHAGYATAAYAAQHIPHLLHEALSGRPNRAEGAQTQGCTAWLTPFSTECIDLHVLMALLQCVALSCPWCACDAVAL
jgi:serine/threonine protein phosphatase PrpC